MWMGKGIGERSSERGRFDLVTPHLISQRPEAQHGPRVRSSPTIASNQSSCENCERPMNIMSLGPKNGCHAMHSGAMPRVPRIVAQDVIER